MCSVGEEVMERRGVLMPLIPGSSVTQMLQLPGIPSHLMFSELRISSIPNVVFVFLHLVSPTSLLQMNSWVYEVLSNPLCVLVLDTTYIQHHLYVPWIKLSGFLSKNVLILLKGNSFEISRKSLFKGIKICHAVKICFRLSLCLPFQQSPMYWVQMFFPLNLFLLLKMSPGWKSGGNGFKYKFHLVSITL